MGEVLGVAASVLQLVDAATKLKDICEAFKNAPTDFAELVDEVSLRARQLKKSKEYLERVSMLDDDLVSKCVENHQQAQLAISAVLNKMEKTFHRQKHIGSIKFVWESSQVQGLRKKLNRAQKLLDRTEGLIDRHERDLVTKEMFSQLQTLLLNSERTLQVVEQDKHLTRRSLKLQTPLPSSKPLHSLERPKKAILTDMQRASNDRQYKIVLPRWLWSKVITLTLRQQHSLVKVTLRCYNVVPWDSEIFKAVRNGDLDRVRDLFNNRQASPLDIQPYGQSLLATAASFCRADICEYLITEGADIGHVSHTGWSALHSLVSVVANGPCGVDEYDYQTYKQSIAKVVSLLAGLVPDDDQEIEELVAKFGFPEYLSSARFLLKGGLSNTKLLSREDRSRLIMRTDSLDMIKDLLGSDLSVRQVLMYAQRQGLSHRKHLETFLEKSIEERHRWSDFIQELIAFDQSLKLEDFHCQNDEMTSIVKICSDEIPFRMTKMSNHHLQTHLVTLQDLGADLEILGQTEQYILRRQGWYTYSHSFEGSFQFRWRMISLETGPQPTDWRIRLTPVDCEYEWAGQFWHWAENPELYIPGAFVDDSFW